ELPLWRQLAATPASVRRRARALAKGLDDAEAVEAETVVGGGSLPGYALPSWAVRLPVPDPDRTAATLRAGNPPVFCRVDEDALLFDLRTVEPDDDERLARAIGYALAQG
ncbi:MAG TPA: L-seryl-tRNA(Sec) selenium transferase, partial [Actinomycetota bacterium]